MEVFNSNIVADIIEVYRDEKCSCDASNCIQTKNLFQKNVTE